MDVDRMSTVEFERFLISRIDDIREAGDGKITRKAINIVLGIDENDEKATETVRRRLQRSTCIKRRGRYYTFTVEEVIDPDDELIASDPELSMMMTMINQDHGFTSRTKPVGPKNLVKKCKHCWCWTRKTKTCSKKEGRHLGVDAACTDGTFSFNPSSLSRK